MMAVFKISLVRCRNEDINDTLLLMLLALTRTDVAFVDACWAKVTAGRFCNNSSFMIEDIGGLRRAAEIKHGWWLCKFPFHSFLPNIARVILYWRFRRLSSINVCNAQSLPKRSRITLAQLRYARKIWLKRLMTIAPRLSASRNGC